MCDQELCPPLRVAKGRILFGGHPPSHGLRLSEHIPIILVAHRATGMRGHRSRAGPCPYQGPGQDRAMEPSTDPKLPARHPGHLNALGRERPALDCVSRPSDRRGPGRDPGAAMCVQGIDVQCVLQFTLINAAGCALHRRTSRVIHRLESFHHSFSLSVGGNEARPRPGKGRSPPLH